MTEQERQRQEAYDVVRPSKYELIDYSIKDGRVHPVALICPGGAYINVCSYVEGIPFAEKLNELGISAFILYYRVRPEANYPNPQDDVAKAVSYLVAHQEELRIDMSTYSIWGSSAGGHLVASFGTLHMGYEKYQLPKPKALVLIYPVVTMKEYTHEDSMHNLLGEHPTQEQIMFASVEEHVTDAYPPTYVWCGAADNCVPPKNSRELAKALENAGVAYQFDEYPGIDHGAGLATGTVAESWFANAVSFWEKQLEKSFAELLR